ncbi:MAG: phosphomannomutase [Gammaproteobacteria bacterium]|jgi:phosphomannomutase|nr:phosphomannomutase [Gammaproteobacteria bacterium]
MDLSCFKAYDLRGRIPDQLNPELAYAIGRAYATWLKPKKVVVGEDIRLTSPALAEALTDGLLASGVDVYRIGECGTEEVYFATDYFEMDGGIMVTASHNPRDYNGMKLVKAEARPISGDTGLLEIKALIESGQFTPASRQGQSHVLAHRTAYRDRLLQYLGPMEAISPLKIVVNPGNGGAGAVIDLLAEHVPFDFVKVHFEADGHFPNGVPNPLLVENRGPTVAAIAESGADLGIAWDGDFDRCFFFDQQGRFIEGYYMVGLLAQAFLAKESSSAIVHDPRLTWNTQDIVTAAGGRPVMSKTGHAFMKETMRAEDAAYGGEMSAHHYFRDFAYCDSGMVPWLLISKLISETGQSLAQLVDERMQAFPASGEINRRVDDAEAVIADISERFLPEAVSTDHTDGLSLEFNDWRFNLRRSNTEPVIRLNVESRGLPDLMEEKTALLLDLVGGAPA